MALLSPEPREYPSPAERRWNIAGRPMKRVPVLPSIIIILIVAGCAHWGGSPVPKVADSPPIASAPQPPAPADTLTRQVLTFYYGWYGRPEMSTSWVHWKNVDVDRQRIDNSTHYPQLGAYDSHDPATVEQHVRSAKAAGITGFIVSWWARGDFHDQGMPLLLETAHRSGLSITVYFETVTPSTPATVGAAVDNVTYLLERYGRRPAWLKVRGRPVIFVYTRAVRQISVTGWQAVRSQVNDRF